MSAAPRVAIFDLDDTLTHTVAVDSEAYVAALARSFGFDRDPHAYHWPSFRNVTDAGILADLFDRAFGRPPSAPERDGFVAALVEELRLRALLRPAAFAPVPGARELLERLRSRGWEVRVATGCYRESARLKLALAELDVPLEHLAGADDAPTRVGIVRAALASVPPPSRSRSVLVGDGPWDVVTARRLGLPVLAVGSYRRTRPLRRLGARAAVSDYRDPERIVRLFEGWTAAGLAGG